MSEINLSPVWIDDLPNCSHSCSQWNKASAACRVDGRASPEHCLPVVQEMYRFDEACEERIALMRKDLESLSKENNANERNAANLLCERDALRLDLAKANEKIKELEGIMEEDSYGKDL